MRLARPCGRFYILSNLLMMKRFGLALRILLGKPVQGLWIDDGTLLDSPDASEPDSSLLPPFDLAFDGMVEMKPPVKIFREGRFRVCVFPDITGETCDDCGAPFHWLALEFEGRKRWYPMLVMHESRLAVMQHVFDQLKEYLVAQRQNMPEGLAKKVH
jgi:hypothetical protein